MDKHLLQAVLVSTAIVVITGITPYVQTLNLLFFFWAWIGVITGIKRYARSTGAPCSIKMGLSIAVLAAFASTFIWAGLFYGIQRFTGNKTMVSFQKAAASVNMEELLEKVPPGNRVYAKETMKSFVQLSPHEALKETTLLLIPMLLIILTICSLIAGLAGALLFGDPPSGIPEPS